ncbi:MAG: GNAT family N-acetyltransferase [Saprospiraceae bacterium]|nr:GNAT family N-acetyltransferase [Saprospiraceae bacterium]
MSLHIQPTIVTEYVTLSPLQYDDFDSLYLVASDPKIWEQHPNKDRWQKEVFSVFFEGAMKSGGAFKIIDTQNKQCIGSTRYYGYDEEKQSILIGYTFYSTAYWGKGYNQSVKTLMLNYIFQFVEKVYFHIGANNIRSQIAISRLGAIKTGEEEVTYFGETSKLNYVYIIEKEAWQSKQIESRTI